ncbi:hypothetical protein [Xanthomonas vasicola]|uniref:hypothetical protein n=2 Tax=Xanthomonas vasicola TaxID=56459 RepID=UPI0001CC018F|nr:hypothetical protein [Xanthomonas vasicola]MBV6744139.1 hypothetical protein [Xanthomonas vasicola pv. musacearum NCPPB 2251]RRJ37076.1 hypothetical protein EIM46_18215 [Xanthomonas vasicola pv. musacearum]HHZ28011.1 hypothetical protein [Xanthomonas vasicola pv. zeae]HHZ42453.1 hypothetical protein [Xanthomonas vasicola pv. zeae]
MVVASVRGNKHVQEDVHAWKQRPRMTSATPTGTGLAQAATVVVYMAPSGRAMPVLEWKDYQTWANPRALRTSKSTTTRSHLDKN